MNPAKEIANVAVPKMTELTITDHAETADEAGLYLTAHTVEVGDWNMTVDYFQSDRAWSVYLNADNATVSAQDMASILAAHEDAQGIADYLNQHTFTTMLNDAAQTRQNLSTLVPSAFVITIP